MKQAFIFLFSIMVFASCVKLGNNTGPGSPGYVDTIGMENIVTTVAGGNSAGSANGTDSLATFNTPFGLAIDDLGNIYVADQLNNCIRKIDTAADYVSTFAGTGTGGFLNGAALASQFNLPVDAAIDKNGNLYIADQANDMIREISPSGVVSTFAGNGSPGLINGNDTTAEFLLPQGVAVDAAGNVYVADEGNNCIRKITPAGNVSTMAGSFTHGYREGNDTMALFNKPEGVAVDAAGNVYVADAGNNVIRKITAAGAVTTLAGNGVFGYTDGAAGTAQFAAPAGVAVDAAGNVYVADEYNAVIRKINTSGTVSTIAGTGVFGYANGTGATAEFNYPSGITLDAAGHIFVADAGNNCIRKIVLP